MGLSCICHTKQSTCIREVLRGKDVLARARTGSGKTAAYALPILNAILLAKVCDATIRLDIAIVLQSTGKAAAGVRALVVVPSKELSKQTKKSILARCMAQAAAAQPRQALVQFCVKDVSVADIATDDPPKVVKCVAYAARRG